MDKISETISNSECISGSFVCGADCVGTNGQLIENKFEPTMFIAYGFLSNGSAGVQFYDANYSKDVIRNYGTTTSKVLTYPLSNFHEFKNNGWYIHSFGSTNNGQTWNYVACK